MTCQPDFGAARPDRIRKIRRQRGFVMAFVLGVFGGNLLTTGKAAASCVGETVDLIDPVVTVVAGPGDPDAEEALWSTFEYLQLIGPDELHIDGAIALFEESP